VLTGLPPWVRSAKIARLSRELRAAGSFRSELCDGLVFSKAESGHTRSERKNRLPCKQQEKYRRIFNRKASRWIEPRGRRDWLRACRGLWVRSAQSAISAQSDVGGLSGSFWHNSAGRRGGFSCLIRAFGFVTSSCLGSWVRLTQVVPMCVVRFA